MSRILISYRREDSADVTGRIYDRLVQQFGAGSIFKDVDSIPFGVDFRKYLDEQVARCDVFLAVIGRDWMKKRGSKGKSRLDDPADYVRIEVESALRRQIPVIPVLVGGATIPSGDRLPTSLRDLSYRNGLAVRSDPDFHRDMDRLIEFLRQAIKGLVDQRTEPSVATEIEDVKRGPVPKAEERPSPVSEDKPSPTPAQKPSPGPVEAEQPASRQSSIRSSKKPRQEAPFEMVKVPKGPFLYGDNKVREVIDHDYWIDQYPVTNRKYAAFISAGGYENQEYWSEEGWKWKIENNMTIPSSWEDAESKRAYHPVVGVSYYEAEAYAKWAGKRLPTEREWEKAARGEDGRVYPWGDQFDESACNSAKSFWRGLFKEIEGGIHTTPVTQYPNGVSPYGCYDMAGNVWEWCADWYDAAKDTRVLHGGSWHLAPADVRSPNRIESTPANRTDKIGFRCAQDIP